MSAGEEEGRDRDREEDREKNQPPHLRMVGRGERHARLVEVGEAVADGVEQRAPEVAVASAHVGDRDAERVSGGGQHGQDGQPDPELPAPGEEHDEGGRKRERQDAAYLDEAERRVDELEPGRRHEGRDAREQDERPRQASQRRLPSRP